MNGRNKHLIADTLGLVWGIVINAADVHDGVRSHELVEQCLGYFHRMKKIPVDDAYKKISKPWVEDNVMLLVLRSDLLHDRLLPMASYRLNGGGG